MKTILVLVLTAWSMSSCAGQPQPTARGISTNPAIIATAPIPRIDPTIVQPPTAVIQPTTTIEPTPLASTVQMIQEYDVPRGSHPHDVAPAPDGTVWYTAQSAGELGRLDPVTGKIHHIALGSGSAPHGVIVGPDGAAWVTDGGLNAIVRVDPATGEVSRFPLPAGSAYANLNTAVFDGSSTLCFTGQSGFYGRLDPKTGKVEVFAAPRGPGPYASRRRRLAWCITLHWRAVILRA